MPIILLCSLQRDQLTTFVHNTSPTSFMFDILKHCGVGLTHIGHILNNKQFANIAPSMRFNCIEVAHKLINGDKLTSSSSNLCNDNRLVHSNQVHLDLKDSVIHVLSINDNMMKNCMFHIQHF